MTTDDIDFIKSMCFQGPDMTERQERRVKRIIDDMRMLSHDFDQKAAELKEAREILAEAETALRSSYNVRDYPADGDTDQDRSSNRIQRFLNP